MRTHRLLLLLAIPTAGLAACAPTPSPVQVNRIVPSRVPAPLTEEQSLDMEITALVCTGRERRALMESESPLSWMAAYWQRMDPWPETPANEALDVFRLRARYLKSRFGEVPLARIDQPWATFLLNGHWDWIQSGARFNLLESRRRVGPSPPGSRGDATREVGTDLLRYSTPRPFTVVLSGGSLASGQSALPAIPRVEDAWTVVSAPTASREEKEAALRAVTWFETAEVAANLLRLEPAFEEETRSAFEEACRRLAVRRSYLLGPEGARRIAAIAAVGASPVMQLERTLGEEYDPLRFQSDLNSLFSQLPRDEPPGRWRAPHPRLRADAESLLHDLATIFPTPKSVTGWDWRGDASLVFGPPHQELEEEHLLYYVYGAPRRYTVRSGVLGAVDAYQSGDLLAVNADFLRADAALLEEERSEAATTLAGIIPELSSVTGEVLKKLNRLLPYRPRRLNYVGAGANVGLTTDVLPFPNPDGTYEVIAGLGLPFLQMEPRAVGSALQSDVKTALLIVDNTLGPAAVSVHDGGFEVQPPRGDPRNAFLVDVFQQRVDPGIYFAYCSMIEPASGRSEGLLYLLDLTPSSSEGPSVSPIALVGRMEADEGRGAFRRGDLSMVPYPGRNLLYGEEIWLYFEISGLARSEYGDCAWEESYYLIPDSPRMGVVKVSPGITNSSLRPQASRHVMVDLSEMESDYSGPVYIVVLVHDVVAGHNALSAARFYLSPP